MKMKLIFRIILSINIDYMNQLIFRYTIFPFAVIICTSSSRDLQIYYFLLYNIAYFYMESHFNENKHFVWRKARHITTITCKLSLISTINFLSWKEFRFRITS